MRKLLSILLAGALIVSCKENSKTGEFTLNGDIKNLPDQKVYLEQLFFSEANPAVVDTGDIKNGKFEVSTVATEEGLYRIRFEKNEGGFIFINDAPQISFNADINNTDLKGPDFNTKANNLLKDFLINLSKISTEIQESNAKLQALQSSNSNDSAIVIEKSKISEGNIRFKNYIINYIDTTSDPVVAMFALGYTRGIDPKELNKSVPSMAKRFPKHQGVIALVDQYNKLIAQPPAVPQQTTQAGPTIGSIAPEITMPDVDGQPFSLSSLRGKYVLVDFWASWCGPCRRENPNVVAAYNKFKNKNFTILGVSLDQDKAAWLKAIKDDNLNWKQISDLKYWNSAAVPLYGFDGIPYNVLVDPEGKIIATLLREGDLHNKLAEVLR